MAKELATKPGTLDFREFNEDTPLFLDPGENQIVVTVRSACLFLCPAAPPTEVLKFLLVCRNARLNPWLGEAHLILMGKKDPKWQVVISKSGFLKHALKHPTYNGHESGVVVVRQGKIIELPGTVMPPDATLVGGWCKVYKKKVDRPIYRRISLMEYDKGHGLWNSIPCTMIEKCAVAATFRDAFNVGGYESDEVDAVFPLTPAPEAPAAGLDYVTVSDGPMETVNGEPAADLKRIGFPYKPIRIVDGEPQVDGKPLAYTLPDVPSAPLRQVILDIDQALVELGATEEDRASILARRKAQTFDELSDHDAKELLTKLLQQIEMNAFVERVATAKTAEIREEESRITEHEPPVTEPRQTVPAETVELPDVPRGVREPESAELQLQLTCETSTDTDTKGPRSDE